MLQKTKPENVTLFFNYGYDRIITRYMPHNYYKTACEDQTELMRVLVHLDYCSGYYDEVVRTTYILPII